MYYCYSQEIVYDEYGPRRMAQIKGLSKAPPLPKKKENLTYRGKSTINWQCRHQVCLY